MAESEGKTESPSQRLNRLEKEKEAEVRGHAHDTLSDYEKANLQRQREAAKDRELIALKQQMSSSNKTTASNQIGPESKVEHRLPKVILPQPKRRKAASASQ